MRSIVTGAAAALLVLACSSSSSSDTKPECFGGTYDVTYGSNTSGNTLCAELTGQHDTATYVVDTATGKIAHSFPATGPNDTPDGPNLYDEQTCRATVGYGRQASDASCPSPLDTFDYDLSFTSSGFTGTMKSAVCTKDSTSGTFVTQSCFYPITGKKQ